MIMFFFWEATCFGNYQSFSGPVHAVSTLGQAQGLGFGVELQHFFPCFSAERLRPVYGLIALISQDPTAKRMYLRSSQRVLRHVRPWPSGRSQEHRLVKSGQGSVATPPSPDSLVKVFRSLEFRVCLPWSKESA